MNPYEDLEARGFVTIAEAARRADMPYHTVRNWVKSNRVKSIHRLGRVFVDIASLEEFLRT